MTTKVLVSALAAGLAIAAFSTSARADVGDYSGVVAFGDFDGDGELERAVSSPETNCGKGAVYVRESWGSVTTWTHDTPGLQGAARCNNYFGTSMAVGDFDGDGYDDLAIGSPGYLTVIPGPINIYDAGAVNVLDGSPNGLSVTGDQLWGQNSSGIADTAEEDDHFGDTVAAGDFDCDGYDDLVIGAPREDMSGETDSGVVHVLYGGSGGVTSTDDLWYQGAGGVDGVSEAGDHFGGALATGNFNDDSSGGDDCEDLAIASPDEDLNSGADAGHVYIIDGSTTGLGPTSDQSIHQNTSGVAGAVEADDHFGQRLRVFDDDGDAFADLEIAVPGDTCTPGHGMGRQVMPGSSGGVSTANDRLECSVFLCALDGDEYWCRADSPEVHAATTNDTINLFVGADAAWGRAGDDKLFGEYGDDALFGGPDDDELHGGGGFDVLIGGDGDDVFVVDLDCEVDDGGIIDGGPGTDVVKSHMSQSELAAEGVVLASIESYVTISEGAGTCDLLPFEEGPFVRPLVTLSWNDLPNANSVFQPTDDHVELKLENTSDVAADVTVTFRLVVRGYAAEVETSAIAVAASGTATYDLDLNDFIPAGTTQEEIDDVAKDIPTSAVLTASGKITVGREGADAGSSHAPEVYGHVDSNEDPVLYRIEARDSTYRGGDLISWRISGAGVSSANFAGIHEATLSDIE